MGVESAVIMINESCGRAVRSEIADDSVTASERPITLELVQGTIKPLKRASVPWMTSALVSPEWA